MLIFKTIESLKAYVKPLWNKQIGLVPTMGALHQGHLELIKKSLADNDIIICSIYVNPTQFNSNHDFIYYPKKIEKDLKLLKDINCTAVFMPEHSEMYPNGSDNLSINIDFCGLTEEMEGKHRSDHFRGVTIIISKLFNIVRPTRAYFGKKDYQQYLVIKYLAEELSFGVEVISCRTVRETDGLALSSRNLRLSESARKLFAPKVYQKLQKSKQLWEQNYSVLYIKNYVISDLKDCEVLKLDYFEIADGETLTILKDDEKDGKRKVVLCMAVFLENIRLIDNIIINDQG